MKIRSIVVTAALLGCLSCVRVDSQLGGNLVPIDQQYRMFSCEVPITDIAELPTDSLSGFSQKRICIGAIRDEEFGLTTKKSAITLVPVYDTVDFGDIQKVYSFYFDAAFDTVSVASSDQKRILQNVYVHELDGSVALKEMVDGNDVEGLIKTRPESIVKGTPILDGESDLIFQFTIDYALKVANACNGRIMSEEFDEYLEQIPGICFSTDLPAGNSGRFNFFDCQLGYNSSSESLDNTYAILTVSSIFDGGTEPVDTSFLFYYGLLDYANADSLITNSSNGSYPQYAFNISTHESRIMSGQAADICLMEGGGGIKPVIRAESLKNNIIQAIKDTLAANNLDPESYASAVINKASVILPFTAPQEYSLFDYFPQRINPVCRIVTDTTTTFMALTDSSSEDENQGDINYSLGQFEPDASYHIQQLIKTKEDIGSKMLHNYDIWLLIMGSETTTTTSSTSDELSEYYQYLAYQSYYNNMYGGGYGGYGGYSSYGYGNSYNNYYSYMMAAMYASQSSTSTSTDWALDTDRYYRGNINGPANAGRKPYVKLTFSIPR